MVCGDTANDLVGANTGVMFNTAIGTIGTNWASGSSITPTTAKAPNDAATAKPMVCCQNRTGKEITFSFSAGLSGMGLYLGSSINAAVIFCVKSAC